jgi:hypothetical protein
VMTGLDHAAVSGDLCKYEVSITVKNVGIGVERSYKQDSDVDNGREKATGRWLGKLGQKKVKVSSITCLGNRSFGPDKIQRQLPFVCSIKHHIADRRGRTPVFGHGQLLAILSKSSSTASGDAWPFQLRSRAVSDHATGPLFTNLTPPYVSYRIVLLMDALERSLERFGCSLRPRESVLF